MFFQMGCYNQYKAIGCSYTYTECKSKHAHAPHFGTLGTGHYYRDGGGGYKKK